MSNSSNVSFVISSNPDSLAAAIANKASATVEAEYGERVVEGSELTLAHHGERAGNPAPCLAHNGCANGVDVVGLSHIDLDALGGCAAILERKPDCEGFWRLAAFVDVNGPHKLGESGASEQDLRRLHAYWAWSQANRVFPPRDGSVLDVTEKVSEAVDVVLDICLGHEGYLKAGDEFRAKEESLNKDSFVEQIGDVIVRAAGGFTNHLYVSPDGSVAKAVVALRTDFHACTVSFADPIEGVTCRDIVQKVWTDKDEDGNFLAGGHDTIGGGPRELVCGLDDLRCLRDATVKALS